MSPERASLFPLRNSHAGFSLAEIMIAIAIGGAMTALAVPNFRQMREGYRLRGATHQVFTALQRARIAAVKENNRYRFSVAGSTYTVHSDANNNNAINDGETVTNNDIHNTATNVSISSTATIVFATDGTATTTGTVTVSNSSGSHTISVSPAGRVRINL